MMISQVSVAGEEQSTITHFETTNPQFATSVSFPHLALPQYPELSAPLRFSLYDYDKWYGTIGSCTLFSAP
jgi:hypothetical protein